MATLNPRNEEGLFYILAAIGGLVSAVGVGAALYMEHTGHVVTGMNNQIVWGLPHVFAIFLIVAASGVLNVASIGSVFGKVAYKSRAPLSGLLSLAMLSGGLAVIMLDLGRADRLMVAATHFNPTSVFGWNVILYPGMYSIVAIYLWTLMERRMNPYSKAAGMATFIWRILLTTGTGSIFGFLVARQAYGTALLAPMFIIMSFAWGLAVFMVVQKTMFGWNGLVLHPEIRKRMKNLLGIFVSAVFYCVAVYHLNNAYFRRERGIRALHAARQRHLRHLFWGGWLLIRHAAAAGHAVLIQLSSTRHGADRRCPAGDLRRLLPALRLHHRRPGLPARHLPRLRHQEQLLRRRWSTTTSPSLPEILLAFGGFGIAFTMTTVGVRILRFLPQDDIAHLEAAGSITD
jgi:Ni/Fe-hydrogenase subunit HybB-like protein